MKKFVFTILCFFICVTVNAEVCNDYELRLRDNLGKEEVIKCFTDYDESKKAMNDYETDETHVTVIYFNNKLINAKYAFVKLDGFNTILNNDGYAGLQYLYQNASDLRKGIYRYTYVSGAYGSDAVFLDYDPEYKMIKLKISGFVGWVSERYAAIVPLVDMYKNTVTVLISDLTLRGGAGVDFDSYGLASKGSTYTYSDIIDDGTYKWYKIDYNGTVRYLAQNKTLTYLSVNSGITVLTYYKESGNYLYHTYRGTGGNASSIKLVAYDIVSDILKKNTKYYSFDGNYFYLSYYDMIDDYKNNTYSHAVNYKKPFYFYYQYLPMHSKSGYSALQFDKIITDNRYTGNPDPNIKYIDDNGKILVSTSGLSILYGKGANIIEIADKYGVNAFSIFVTAVHEGAFGSSVLSIAKNNPFGHGAYDGCWFTCATKYESVEAAIESHAKNYVSAYGIPTYVYYMGSFYGNKGSGMNVNYASDPYWGEKQAAIFFRNDNLYGGSDYDSNTIGIKQTDEAIPIYKEPSEESNVIYLLQNNRYKYKTSNMSLIVSDKVVDSNGDYWYKVYTEVALTEDRVISSDRTSYSFDYSYGYVKSDKLYVENKQPVITGISDKAIRVGDEFDIMNGVTCIDNEDGDITEFINVEGTVDTSRPGIYDLTYSIVDSNKFGFNKTIRVTVSGDTIPSIDARDITVSEKYSFDPMDNVSAFDSVDGDISHLITIEENTVDINKIGDYKITYKVANLKGIVTRKTIIVKVVADIEPLLYIASIETEVGKTINVRDYIKAVDKEDGNLTDKVVITGIVDFNKAGIYNLNFSLNDSYGHSINKEAKVIVGKYVVKDGSFYLHSMKYENNLLNVSGFLAVMGIDNIDSKFDLIFDDKNSNKEYAISLDNWISESYPRSYSDGKNKYNSIWFKDGVDLSLIPAGEYTIYIRSRIGNYEGRNLFRNIFLLDVTKKAVDGNGRGYYFRNNNYEREFPMEVVIRDNGLISNGITKHSSNMYNSYNSVSITNGNLNITGYSFNINGDYSGDVSRKLVLEEISSGKRYYYDIGYIKGKQIALNVDDGMSRVNAWFNTLDKVSLNDIEKGHYILYVQTISSNGIDDFGELRDIFLNPLPNSVKLNGKKYELYLNKDNWFRLELIVS